jgi:thiol-disulfide isomerase/thioredoxin
MKCRALLALFAAAALLAGCGQRSDQQLLAELHKLSDTITEKSDAATREQRAEQAEGLIKEFESRHAGSPLLNEARGEALKVMAQSRTPAATAAETARKLRDEAPKGSTLAAQGDLFLFGQEWAALKKGAGDGTPDSDVWQRHAKDLRGRLERLLKTYPKNRDVADLAAQALAVAELADDLPTRRLILELVSQQQPGHPLARVAERDQAIGKEFHFEFTPVGSDKRLSVKDLRGKVVVVDFWATWCAPCVAEMPRLRALYEQYQGKGLEIIGVSLDHEQGKLTSFVKARDIRWPQAFGAAAEGLKEEWGVKGIPTVFLLDRQGCLHSLNARGKLEKLVPELLAEK